MNPEAQMRIYRGYTVTDTGLVFSKASKGKRLLKQALSQKGYPVVYLCFDSKTKAVKVHRLVAQLFVPNPDHKREVNHKDGNKTNNNANNLEWCTRSENVRHAYQIGLREPTRGKKGAHDMTTIEKLRLGAEIEAANAARVQEFLKAQQQG